MSPLKHILFQAYCRFLFLGGDIMEAKFGDEGQMTWSELIRQTLVGEECTGFSVCVNLSGESSSKVTLTININWSDVLAYFGKDVLDGCFNNTIDSEGEAMKAASDGKASKDQIITTTVKAIDEQFKNAFNKFCELQSFTQAIEGSINNSLVIARANAVNAYPFMGRGNWKKFFFIISLVLGIVVSLFLVYVAALLAGSPGAVIVAIMSFCLICTRLWHRSVYVAGQRSGACPIKSEDRSNIKKAIKDYLREQLQATLANECDGKVTQALQKVQEKTVEFQEAVHRNAEATSKLIPKIHGLAEQSKRVAGRMKGQEILSKLNTGWYSKENSERINRYHYKQVVPNAANTNPVAWRRRGCNNSIFSLQPRGPEKSRKIEVDTQIGRARQLFP